ncbi:1624_t:CDS:2, partial [Ambispora gerdemannii]
MLPFKPNNNNLNSKTAETYDQEKNDNDVYSDVTLESSSASKMNDNDNSEPSNHSQTQRTESEISDMSLVDLVKQGGQVVQNKIDLLSNAVVGVGKKDQSDKIPPAHIPAEGSTASEGVGFKPAEAQDSHSQTRRTESEISDMPLVDLVKQSGQVVQNKIDLLSNAVVGG